MPIERLMSNVPVANHVVQKRASTEDEWVTLQQQLNSQGGIVQIAPGENWVEFGDTDEEVEHHFIDDDGYDVLEVVRIGDAAVPELIRLTASRRASVKVADFSSQGVEDAYNAAVAMLLDPTYGDDWTADEVILNMDWRSTYNLTDDEFDEFGAVVREWENSGKQGSVASQKAIRRVIARRQRR